MGFDTETTSLMARGPNKRFKVVSIALSDDEMAYYFPINHRFYSNNFSEREIRDILGPIFRDRSVELIAHDYKFDRHVLNRIGIEVSHDNFFDTLIAARMVNENEENNLESCIERFIGYDDLMKYDEVVDTVSKTRKKAVGMSSSEKADFNLVHTTIAGRYACEDVYFLPELRDILKNKLKEENQLDIYNRFMIPEYNNVLFKKEKRGFNIDDDKLIKMEREMSEDIKQLKEEMYDIVGMEVNLNSPKQISELLYAEYTSDSPCEICDECCDESCEDYKLWDKYGHKNPNIGLREVSFNFPVPERTDTGQPSSGKSALKRFQHYEPKNERQKEGLEFIDKYLEYKGISKLKSTFVDGIMSNPYNDGKIHTAFSQLGTRSGRLASSNINVQNLPDQDEDDDYRIRELFIPDEDDEIIIAADYENLEMKILAEFSEDSELIEMFDKGWDVHGATAKSMFPTVDCHPNEVKKKYPTERTMGKLLNFMISYGASHKSLYYTLMDVGVDLEDEELQNKLNAYSGMNLAKVLHRRYFDTFSGVKEFISKQKKKGRKQGFVETLLGRKIRLQYMDSRDYKKRGYSERVSYNGKVQGSASDIIMIAQLKVENDDKLKEMGTRQVLQVHDELVFVGKEGYKDEICKRINKLMTNPLEGIVETKMDYTVDYDTGPSYFHAK